MIAVDNDLIEQIVANVLAELQPAPTVRAPVVPAAAPPVEKTESSILDFDLPVITAEQLEERVQKGQTVRIDRRAILTPSARDWLASRKISWSRRNSGAGSSTSSAAHWRLVLTTVTPAVSTLRQSLTGWKIDLLGTAQEAADHAIRSICTGETDGMLGICGAAETVACLTNRNPKLRAAVLACAADLPGLVEQFSPNFLVINPRGKSFVELRNLVRAVESSKKPRDRHPWVAGN